MASVISQLAKTIAVSTENLVKHCERDGVRIPSLDDEHSFDEDKPFSTGELGNDVHAIVTAALQLVATVMPAELYVFRAGTGYCQPAAMNAVLAFHIPEILREGPSSGMHVKDIAEKCDADPEKIGRIMRLLSTNFIFKEVDHDVFANNRHSLALDSGLSTKTLSESSSAKLDTKNGYVALMELATGAVGKGVAAIPEHLADKTMSRSTEAKDSTLSKALGTGESLWDWIRRPENERMVHIYATALPGENTFLYPPAYTTMVKWDELPKGSLVVGLASSPRYVLDIAKASKNPNFVLQEFPLMAQKQQQLWVNEIKAIGDGRIQFQAHDPFSPQPTNSVSVFIAHTLFIYFPDKETNIFLSHLRAAAVKNHTSLLFIENIPDYRSIPKNVLDASSCHVFEDTSTLISILGMSHYNWPARSYEKLREQLRATGWDIEHVHVSQTGFCQVKAIAI